MRNTESHMRLCWTASLVAVGLAMAPQALANGGPVQMDYIASPRGNVVPRDVKGIRLISEDLHITLLDDGNSYSVEASYRLSNPRRRRIRFGVPLAWGDPDETTLQDGPNLRTRRKVIGKAARSVRIKIGSRTTRCRTILPRSRIKGKRGSGKSARRPNGAVSWKYDIARKSALGSARIRRPGARSPGLPASYLALSESFQGLVWCVAVLNVPAGEVPLELQYQGELEHWEDWADTNIQIPSPYDYDHPTFVSPRYLRYALFPAGYWAGPARRVVISVDPGPYGKLADPLHPAGVRRSGGKLLWELKNVNLRRLETLAVRLDARPLLRRRELNTFNRGRELGLRTRASRPGSLAARVLDGHIETAWCVGGSKDTAGGEWIEIRATSPPRVIGKNRRGGGLAEAGCNLRGIALFPGHGKNRGTFAANGRVTKVRIGVCQGNEGVDVTLPVTQRFELAGALIELDANRESNNQFYRRWGGAHADYGSVVVAKSATVKKVRNAWKLSEKGKSWRRRQPCFRLTIIGAVAGNTGKTCIGEVAPILHCGG